MENDALEWISSSLSFSLPSVTGDLSLSLARRNSSKHETVFPGGLVQLSRFCCHSSCRSLCKYRTRVRTSLGVHLEASSTLGAATLNMR